MVPFLFKSNEKNNLPSLKFFPQTMRAKAAKIKWGPLLFLYTVIQISQIKSYGRQCIIEQKDYVIENFKSG